MAETAANVMEAPAAEPALVAVRECEGCTLCCKIIAVRALDKPQNAWCKHCRPGAGCGIYDTRPGECRTYLCGYLVLADLGEEWKPSTSRMIVSSEVSPTRLNIHVDPGRPDAWRRQPYYGQLKQWARRAAEQRGQICVMVGPRTIVVLPEHDVDLGVMADNELVVITETPRPGKSPEWEAYAVDRTVGAGQAIDAAKGKSVAMPSDVGAGAAGFRAGHRLA